MPHTQKFNDLDPLDYYYGSGYKVLNPFCRIISANPQYRYILEARNGRNEGNQDGHRVLADSIATRIVSEFLMENQTMPRHRMAQDSGFDNDDLIGIGRNNASAEARMNVRERLSSLLAFLEQTKTKIASMPLNVGGDMLIRGDSRKMQDYLEALGINFPDISTPYCQMYRKSWRTNQFFSTTLGYSLASVASRPSLVWLIRIDPTKTKGRSGGLYASEDEVLFPYDVHFQLEGVIHVGAETNIAGLKLNLFPNPERIRAALVEIYRANRFTQQSTPRFLVASECY